VTTNAVNVGEIDEAADRLVTKGLATMTGKKYNIDVSKLGIDRVLGSGRVSRKLNLKGVKSITSRAREKITSIGGTLDLPEE
jgi:large subunit ribosomal protein L15